MQPTEENHYLKKNVERLRDHKRRLEEKVQDLEQRLIAVEQRKQQYKSLYEETQREWRFRDSGELEISSLHQQLRALVHLKDALNTENIDLHSKLEATQRAQNEESKQGACVICMDNLANLVCMPCRHLALCAYCGEQPEISDCPICRAPLEDRLQIYTP